MIIIGDIHGKLDSYHNIIKNNLNQDTIQLGDFGFLRHHDWHLKNLNSFKHQIVFGNHDWYPYLDKPYSTKNTSWIPEINACTFRGALSIDTHLRTTGIDWFPNEEMNYKECQNVIDEIKNHKPDIILSHTCPLLVKKQLFSFAKPLPSITEQAMNILFKEYQPKLWIFGHYHKSKNEIIEGTRFICLDELEIYKI